MSEIDIKKAVDEATIPTHICGRFENFPTEVDVVENITEEEATRLELSGDTKKVVIHDYLKCSVYYRRSVRLGDMVVIGDNLFIHTGADWAIINPTAEVETDEN